MIRTTIQILPKGTMLVDGAPSGFQGGTAPDAYRHLAISYPKFFKMDALCQWAFLGAELLLRQAPQLPDANRTGLVLATTHGCLTVDKAFLNSLETVPSPALFVYTLPNIMLGEVSIRHGFKGEQLCLAQSELDEAEIMHAAEDFLTMRGMDAVLAGYVDEHEGRPDVRMWWLHG